MAEPRFAIGQEVHLAQKHCALCKKLEFELRHPIRVTAIEPYGDQFEYRIEDALGAHYQTKEKCLCNLAFGHEGSPCAFCGAVAY